MMIPAKKTAVPELWKDLTGQYYKKHDLPPAIYECSPIAGAGTVEI